MTGLEKILDSISSDAEETANKILEKAEQKALELEKYYETKTEEELNELTQKATTQIENILKRARTSSQTHKNKLILKAKQDIISQKIQQAKEYLCHLPAKDYFAILLSMIEKFSLPQTGEIVFSEQDKTKIPEDFSEKVQAIVKEKKGSLAISKDTRKIDGGFVLVYGEVEQNCSFDSLFAEANDALCDLINQILFCEPSST